VSPTRRVGIRCGFEILLKEVRKVATAAASCCYCAGIPSLLGTFIADISAHTFVPIMAVKQTPDPCAAGKIQPPCTCIPPVDSASFTVCCLSCCRTHIMWRTSPYQSGLDSWIHDHHYHHPYPARPLLRTTLYLPTCSASSMIISIQL
jgi:hypothetical protein